MSVCRSISSGIETTGVMGAGAPLKFLQLNKGVLSHSLRKPHHMHLHILNKRDRCEFQRVGNSVGRCKNDDAQMD